MERGSVEVVKQLTKYGVREVKSRSRRTEKTVKVWTTAHLEVFRAKDGTARTRYKGISDPLLFMTPSIKGRRAGVDGPPSVSLTILR